MKVTVRRYDADTYPADGWNGMITLMREFEAAKVETKIDSNAGEIMAVVTSMGKCYAYNLKYYHVEIQ